MKAVIAGIPVITTVNSRVITHDNGSRSGPYQREGTHYHQQAHITGRGKHISHSSEARRMYWGCKLRRHREEAVEERERLDRTRREARLSV